MKKIRLKRAYAVILAVVALVLPVTSYAHEVYVLTSEEILRALATPPLSPFVIITENLGQFFFWALVAIVAFTTFFFMSLSRKLERKLHPIFLKLRQYAPPLIRLGVGGSLIFCAFNSAIFGPELPLVNIFGSWTFLAAHVLGLAGLLIFINKAVRFGACIGLVYYVLAVATYGLYLITYIEFAAAFVFLIIGSAHEEFSARFLGEGKRKFAALATHLRPYRFAIVRVGFGLSVMFASLYAKVFYSHLALLVVEKYDLTSLLIFSSFSPEFLVLGAAIVEFLCGLLIVLGIEIRHTAAFLAVWLVLSLFYFREMVWPHVILFGLGGAFLLYGFDWYSLEGRFLKRGNREPVL